MLLRIRSPDGSFRLDVQSTTPGEEFAQKIQALIPGPVVVDSIKLANRPHGGEEVPMGALQGRKVGDMGFNHGDMLFLSYTSATEAAMEPVASSSTGTQTRTAQTLSGKTVLVPVKEPSVFEPIEGTPVKSEAGSTKPQFDLSKVKEMSVDQFWRAKNGKIPRKKDEKFCKHGAKGMCDYCMPLEPYDMEYHTQHQIKHLSYYAYLTKLQAGNSQNTSSSANLPPLTPLNYRVTIPCPSEAHASWPAGICSKCQPSAITLQSQPYRMVDHVEFASADLINSFLDSWRKTGFQRFGLLIGRYQPYEEVPMGIKAVVEAIHEIEQDHEVDGIGLGESFKEEMKRVNEIAGLVCPDLRIVGMIYTDLTPEPEDKTKIQYKRHGQSFFFSSLETIFSAQMQLLNPTATRSSPTGTFSSRFVSCVLTGDKSGGAEALAFQVAEQGVAMVQADMIEASVDPGTVRVKQESGDRYVPDVFFSHKNEYGLQVKENAKPCFPVEYLLVTLTHGFVKQPRPLFRSLDFPIENRYDGHQSLENLATAIRRIVPEVDNLGTISPDFLDQEQQAALSKTFSDWHLFAFLPKSGLFDEDTMRTVGRVMISHESGDHGALADLFKSEAWGALTEIARSMKATKPAARPAQGNDGFEEIPQHLLDEMNAAAAGPAPSDPSGPKACPHCTFENPSSNTDCELCGLPLSG